MSTANPYIKEHSHITMFNSKQILRLIREVLFSYIECHTHYFFSSNYAGEMCVISLNRRNTQNKTKQRQGKRAPSELTPDTKQKKKLINKQKEENRHPARGLKKTRMTSESRTQGKQPREKVLEGPPNTKGHIHLPLSVGGPEYWEELL